MPGIKGNRHPDETVAACMAALAVGATLETLSKQYGVSKPTLSRWKKQVDELRAESPNRDEQLVDLVKDNLAALLRTQNAILEAITSNPKWLFKHSPSQVAVLFGVMSDKSFRTLVASQGGGAPALPPGDPLDTIVDAHG